MSEQEIKAAFAAFDQTHPFYAAVLALLDEEVRGEQIAVTIPNSPDNARHFNAGRLAHALDFRAVFNGVMRESLAEQAAAVQRAELAQLRRANAQSE